MPVADAQVHRQKDTDVVMAWQCTHEMPLGNVVIGDEKQLALSCEILNKQDDRAQKPANSRPSITASNPPTVINSMCACSLQLSSQLPLPVAGASNSLCQPTEHHKSHL